MPEYRIEVGSAARGRFGKLDPAARARIARSIDALALDPRPAGVKRLAAPEELYRIRVGAYRVVYAIEDDVLVILVVKIGHRRDVYQGL